ncbi:Dolichyl-phosphate-mannose-protein mannosyltransferase [Halopelagius inordinatus]|uniref:Dolichyl-phosphate-mannose-protein mannosyltransferase n=1 Tax=Halopelagius inordinatus TaxID=553467 RepID=A0A1I2RSB5_9EURY|nr:glycosyltransferase family 39 protein [Halopelagius inordinatus]SFG43408.1 Dolichyl-phosphate-mannose-protein mannosyltransferase [Halopelagius inordinatus]
MSRRRGLLQFDRFPRIDRGRAATFLLAAVAAAVSLVVAARLFPYHSLNHDEGVYLQQAELLLRGRLFLRPPVEDAFRPWFFVEGDDGLYAKYAPLPAAVFAVGKLAGGFPLALAAVSAAVAGLTTALGRELFDAPTGAVAGLLLLASPLFLVHTGVYLPYATTTALNLAFALAYLRAERRGSLPAAVAAGIAVGLAFFARPFTAVLFAAPFVAHACWTLVRSGAWRTVVEGTDGERRALFTRRAATAALGLAGVAVAFGYNWVVTGDPLVFPYQAFGPEDGPGFGHRELLGHEVDYTLSLATRANAEVLFRLFENWVAAGPVGTALAALGTAELLRNRDGEHAARRALLAALFVTVPLGNLAFWGNYNVLGSLASQTDGLLYFLGPYYHFDLLVPTAVFGARGAFLAGDRVRRTVRERLSPVRARRVTLAVMVVSAAALGGIAATTADGPLERNDRVSDELTAGYEPFAEGGAPDDALVFLPTPYGPWLNHPFQALRNAPGYDGETVYALGDTDELAVAGEFPNRTIHRYVYRGSWPPTDDERVDAELVRVERVSGDTVGLDATFGLPAEAERATLRVSTSRGAAYFVANGTPESLRTSVTADERIELSGPDVRSTGNRTVAFGDSDEVTVEVFVSTGPASGFTYRAVFPVERENGTVRTLSPTLERCVVPTQCEPVGVGESPDGTFANATLSNATA